MLDRPRPFVSAPSGRPRPARRLIGARRPRPGHRVPASARPTTSPAGGGGRRHRKRQSQGADPAQVQAFLIALTKIAVEVFQDAYPDPAAWPAGPDPGLRPAGHGRCCCMIPVCRAAYWRANVLLRHKHIDDIEGVHTLRPFCPPGLRSLDRMTTAPAATPAARPCPWQRHRYSPSTSAVPNSMNSSPVDASTQRSRPPPHPHGRPAKATSRPTPMRGRRLIGRRHPMMIDDQPPRSTQANTGETRPYHRSSAAP
jgi:hypothetical protein